MYRVLLATLVCCSIAFSAAPMSAADSAAIVSQDLKPSLLETVKQPAPWVSWGADLRTRLESHHNALSLQGGQANSEFTYLRLRPRIWIDVTPVTNLTFNARFLSEPRFYFRPDSREGWANEEGLMDSLYLQADNIAGQPVRARIGRQDIELGDKWLILDGTPADGTRSEFFDAARFTVGEQRGLSLDLIGIFITSESIGVLPMINPLDDPLAE